VRTYDTTNTAWFMVVVKWVVVVVGSFVGGWIAGLVPNILLSAVRVPGYIPEITHLVGWIVAGVAIWMRLVKFMGLGLFPLAPNCDGVAAANFGAASERSI
jgi:hypothetical protein